jgi:cytochrome c oxidase, subunit II
VHTSILYSLLLSPLQVTSNDWAAQSEVFEQIFFVFLTLGTLVGVVVVSYTLYNVWKYRDTGDHPDGSTFDPPRLGELPTGQQSGKGKKLFLSFGLSAVVVISLVVYSYGLLLYVEQGPTEEVETEIEVEVVGHQYFWEFIYPNGESTSDQLVVPANTRVELKVTSNDVWHNFGAPDLRIKSDAIPGEYSHTWFAVEEPGEYMINCYELCGAGHSGMKGTLTVMEEGEYKSWHQNEFESNSQTQTSVDEEAAADEQAGTDDQDAGADQSTERVRGVGVIAA